MKLIEIVKKLRGEGFRVGYRKRTDGGIYITSIEGTKFTGTAGNNQARMIAGESLTQKQLSQRAESRAKSVDVARRYREAMDKFGLHPKKKYGTKITKRLRSMITKANKALRQTKGKTRVTKRKVKEALRRGESERSILRRLRETEAHAKGKAYTRERQFWESYYRKSNDSLMSKVLEEIGDDLTSEDTEFIRKTEYSSKSREEAREAIVSYLVKQGRISQSFANNLFKQYL